MVKSPFLDCDKKRSLLTARELTVLKLIMEGKNNNQIAGELFISVCTVKAQVASILGKMGVTNRLQAAVKAVRDRVF